MTFKGPEDVTAGVLDRGGTRLVPRLPGVPEDQPLLAFRVPLPYVDRNPRTSEFPCNE